MRSAGPEHGGWANGLTAMKADNLLLYLYILTKFGVFEEKKQMKVKYKIVQQVNGQWTITEPTDIYAWADANDRKATYIPDSRARYLHECLRNQPRIQGLCGPMFDGEKSGVPVIRYEDQASYNILSA